MIFTHRGRTGPRRGGFTLPELLLVLLIMGVMAAMAGPRMVRWVQSIGTRSATNQLLADIALARVQAVREGASTSLRVESPTVYSLTVDDGAGASVQEVKRVDITHHQKGATLSRTGRIRFDSRGLLRADGISGLSVARGTYRDSIEVTVVGRTQRVR